MTGLVTGEDATILTFPSDRKIVMQRVFDAPRATVFMASTDPDLIPSWWGPRRLTTTVEELDLRPGGRWRFVQRDPDGNRYAFQGEYLEIVPPERLVFTFEFDGAPGHAMLETMTFREYGGKTTLTVTDLFDSVEDRDEMLRSGMEDGASESNDRLAELLARLR